jgi:nicotinamide mononucleotide transporter
VTFLDLRVIAETLGVVFGLLSVYYAVRESAWTWTTGTVNVVLFAFLFWEAKLYVNVLLQIIYVLYNVYGWYWWKRGGQAQAGLTISATPARGWWVLAPTSAAATLAIGFVFAAFTDNPLPYWDAATVALSLAAQFMLARKWLENWWVWIAANLIYFGMCLYTALYQIAFLQIVYIALSVLGWLQWKRTLAAAPPHIETMRGSPQPAE